MLCRLGAILLLLCCTLASLDRTTHFVKYVNSKVNSATESGNKLSLEEASLLCDSVVGDIQDGNSELSAEQAIELASLELARGRVQAHLGEYPMAAKSFAHAFNVAHGLIASEDISDEARMYAHGLARTVEQYNEGMPVSIAGGNGAVFDEPTKRTIHFIAIRPDDVETWNATAQLGERQRCAIESALWKNPDALVVVWKYNLSPSDFWSAEEFAALPKNIVFLNLDPELVFRFTPLQDWFQNSFEKGRFYLFDLSDAMRVALLYKFGGVYMDTDVLSLRNISDVRNTLGAEWNECHDKDKSIDAAIYCSVDSGIPYNNSIGNAVLAFDQGHPFLWAVMHNLRAEYNSSKWAHNGPICLNRVYPLWNEQNVTFTGTTFAPVTLLPNQAFYSIGWMNVRHLIHSDKRSKGYKYVNTTTPVQPYLIHFWNKQTALADVQPGSVLQELMQQHCPVSYSTSITRFHVVFRDAVYYAKKSKPRKALELIRIAYSLRPSYEPMVIYKAFMEAEFGDLSLALKHQKKLLTSEFKNQHEIVLDSLEEIIVARKMHDAEKQEL
eukprot:Rmarinus@m.28970